MGVVFGEFLVLELFCLLFAFLFSATDKKYLLKVSFAAIGNFIIKIIRLIFLKTPIK
jgi:hypothetical protein